MTTKGMAKWIEDVNGEEKELDEQNRAEYSHFVDVDEGEW